MYLPLSTVLSAAILRTLTSSVMEFVCLGTTSGRTAERAFVLARDTLLREMEEPVIRVEYWGGPYDGQIEDIGSEYGDPQYQVLTKPSLPGKPVFVRGEDMRKDKPPAPAMVLWQYQGNRNEAIHNGRMIMRVVPNRGK